ncbi:MAG: hypothetical protein WAO98_09250 [Alphaproteobacteria bacterium]
MRFEHYSQPILPHHLWLQRIALSLWLAVGLDLATLVIGVTGYMVFGDLHFIDALLEASMILGGMGPVAAMTNDAVKWFASGYALLSGLVIITTTAILLGPWLHRMMHYFHSDRRRSNRGGQKRRSADR